MITEQEQTLAQILEIYRKRVSSLEEKAEDSKREAARMRDGESSRERERQRMKNSLDRATEKLREEEAKNDKLRMANKSLHLELQAEREAHQKLKNQNSTEGERP